MFNEIITNLKKERDSLIRKAAMYNSAINSLQRLDSVEMEVTHKSTKKRNCKGNIIKREVLDYYRNRPGVYIKVGKVYSKLSVKCDRNYFSVLISALYKDGFLEKSPNRFETGYYRFKELKPTELNMMEIGER